MYDPGCKDTLQYDRHSVYDVLVFAHVGLFENFQRGKMTIPFIIQVF